MACVFPVVSLRARKVKAIALAKLVVFGFIEPEVAATMQYKNKLLARMVIGAPARRSGRKTEEVRFHDCRAGRKKLDMDPRLIGYLFPVAAANQLPWFSGITEKSEHVRLIEQGKFLECCDG